MSGGFGALLGPAGGFIFGFIPMAMLCGAGIKKGFPGKPFVLGIAGLAVCHAFGVVQFSIVTETRSRLRSLQFPFRTS